MIIAIIIVGLVILCGGVLIGFAISEKMYKKEPIPSTTITVTQAKTVPVYAAYKIPKSRYEDMGGSNCDEIIREYLAQDLSQEVMKYAKIYRVDEVSRDFGNYIIYRARIDVLDRREVDT